MLTIATDEVVYKLGPKAKVADTETEDSNDPAVPEEPPVSPTPSFRKPASPPPPPPRSKAGPSREGHWRDLLEGGLRKVWHQQIRKHPPGIGKEGGSEGDQKVGDKEGPIGRTSSRHDSGAESEERRNPEVPHRACGGLQPDPGVGGTSG